jgi:hypothetical protein
LIYSAYGGRCIRDLGAHEALIENDIRLRGGGAVRFAVRIPERPKGASRPLCEGGVARVNPLREPREVTVSLKV